jgi:hypothetical protein
MCFNIFLNNIFLIKIALSSYPKILYGSRKTIKFKTMYHENKKQNLDSPVQIICIYFKTPERRC